MSDFLSRLAGRTMGLTPSVQPLITPMYAHRSTPVGEQSGLMPFDSDINPPVSLHGDTNAPVRAWAAPHPSGTRDTHQAFGQSQGQAPTSGFQAFGQPQGYTPTGDFEASGQPQGHSPTGGFQISGQPQGDAPMGSLSDNLLTAQTNPHQEMDGDRALPLQEEYTEQTHKNHPLPDNGSTSSHPFNTASQHNLGIAPAFRPGYSAAPSPSAEHKDGASIFAEEITLAEETTLAEDTTLHRRGVPLWPPNGPEQMHRADRKDEGHKNSEFAQYDPILPMNELPQSNRPSLSSDEFSQAGVSAPDALSTQDRTLSQRGRAGTSPRPYGQVYANDTGGEQGPTGNALGRTENELEEQRTPMQDWAALLPRQKVPGAESGTSHAATARHGGLKRGNLGGITHQMEQNEIPTIRATTPSIQVTIGRIEVRATPPPPTRSPVQRTAPAIMSLDDYVNQRMKGGR